VPEIERTEPPYLQVVRHIRDQIVSGHLADGDTVPSARQLAADWVIALATATKALSTLRAEGLVRGVPGVGTLVAAHDSLHRSAKDWALSVRRTGRVYPPGHYARVRSAELLPSPDTVATALGLDLGSPVIRRQRTTHDGDHRPVSTSTSWFDGALADSCPALVTTERIPQGTSGYIEAQTGRRVVAGNDQLAAGVTTPADAAELNIEPGSAVLLTVNRWIDTDGAVVEYGESVSPPGRWTLYEYDVEVDQ
jgi:DNA-binding GntR family transcriptional regulator